jgi:spore germination cell wall hydrolase CwlJ-like protein
MITNLITAVNIVFMALVIWREARGESFEAQLAVGFSIMNRVENPKWWGSSVMEVVTKKWQYSSMTDPKDRQLTTWPKEDSVWNKCLEAANSVILGIVKNPAPGADSYHDTSIQSPKWATKQNFVCQIGRLRFHNTDGDE